MLAELTFYGLILYGIIAQAWGISVPLLGAAGLAILVSYFIWRSRDHFGPIFGPLFPVLCCAVSCLLVQLVFYENSLMADENRGIVTWIFMLIIVQSLLAREGFLHRFGLATTIIALLLLPYMVSNYGNAVSVSVERGGLDRSVGLANSDDLAAWFGFCCIFFVVVSVETTRHLIRIASLLAALLFLGLVGLTVTRAALVGIAIGMIVALRRILKRGFVPVLLLAAVVSVVFASGVFDQALSSYMARGTADTGRLELWPLAVQRFVDSPFFGVGADDIATYVPSKSIAITPHNAFLYVALMSGIIPLMLFLWYWLKAIRGAYHLSRKGLQDAPFQLPLLTYTLIQCMFLAVIFMHPWAIVVLCNAIPRRSEKFIIDENREIGTSRKQNEIAHGIGRAVSIRAAKS
jgi:O-antigen ligase